MRKREELATAQAPAKTQSKNTNNILAEMQKKAAKQLENDKIVTTEAEQKTVQLSEPTIIVKKKTDAEEKVKSDIREELNRKTAEANKKYQEIASNVTEEIPQVESIAADVETSEEEITNVQEEAIEEGFQSELEEVSKGVKNVFKTVEQTKKPSVTGDRRKRKRRMDKKGGGRQKMEKKLNR